MKEYISILKMSGLFDDIEYDNIKAMLECLDAKILSFQKGETIFHEGQEAKEIGIVVSGSVQVVQDDFYGNRSIVTRIEASGLFGESFACARTISLPVSIIAAENSKVMLVDSKRIMNACCNACEFHKQIIYNLLHVMAMKNLIFHQKIEITSKRTTREKLMTYLLAMAKQNHSNSFTIPYDRQALADYLGVDRSAMSAEISKLRKEGVIECQKSNFKIL